jgi:hypothetical protein
MKTYTIRQSIAWGGTKEDETLQDVFADLQKAAPTIQITLLEARPAHTGGWPIFELTFGDDDLAAIAALWDIEVSELLELAVA